MTDTKKAWTSPELESLDKNASDVEAGAGMNADPGDGSTDS